MNNEQNVKKYNKYWLIYIAVAVVIAVSSFIICIFDYRQINDTFGLYVTLTHLFMSFVLLIVSVVLKVIFKKNISLLLLILVVIVCVTAFGNFFHAALDYDGVLYPLIEYGGPLYFLRIGDYDFDGISNIGVHPLEENVTRTVTYSPVGSRASAYIEKIDFKINVQTKGEDLGKGVVDDSRNLIIFDLDDDVYKVSALSVRVYLHILPEGTSVKFYRSNENGAKLNYISTKMVDSRSFMLNLDSDHIKTIDDKLYLYYEAEVVKNEGN